MNVKNQQGYDDGKHAVTKGFKSRFVHRHRSRNLSRRTFAPSKQAESLFKSRCWLSLYHPLVQWQREQRYGQLAVKDRQIELAEPRSLAEDVYFGDLPV